MSAGLCSYLSLPIFRQWTKYAFLELKDPSQVEWVLGLHNTPIPNCPSKVSCLSCDVYSLSWHKKHLTHMDRHVTCIDCHVTFIDCHVTCMCSSRVISVHLTQKQFVLNRAGRSMWVYQLCRYWSHDHHCIAFWSLSTFQCPATPTDLSDSSTPSWWTLVPSPHSHASNRSYIYSVFVAGFRRVMTTDQLLYVSRCVL